MLTELGTILTLILASGVFAGAEIAILSMRRTRISELADLGKGSARALESLRAEPERLLATVQIGITVLGAGAAAFGGARLARPLGELLGDLGVPYGEQISIALVVAGISFFALMLGELVPKSLALRTAERYALTVGRPLLALSVLLRPFISILVGATNFLLRLFNDETTFSESRLSPDELRTVVEEAAESGSLDRRTGEIASRAFDFGHLTVAAVMVPRSQITAIDRAAAPEETISLLRSGDHQRYPVIDGDLDNVVGYLVTRDALLMLVERNRVDLDDLLRPALFVPSTTMASKGLRELQRNRTQIAMVVDERGELAGVVTAQDFVEELVGDIFKEDEDPREWIVHEESGTAVVRGEMPVHAVNRAMGLSLPESESWSTVAGIALSKSGRMLAVGEFVELEKGIRLEVVDASARRIRRLRIHRVRS